MWVFMGCDVVSKGSAQGFFACGAAVRFDCGQSPCCTAAWWRFESARRAGRCRRPRQGRISAASSTRLRHAAIGRAAVGAAATERWSVRGPVIETPLQAAEASTDSRSAAANSQRGLLRMPDGRRRRNSPFQLCSLCASVFTKRVCVWRSDGS
jgi:hypothetical protein